MPVDCSNLTEDTTRQENLPKRLSENRTCAVSGGSAAADKYSERLSLAEQVSNRELLMSAAGAAAAVEQASVVLRF